ncbi:hypothetical protein HMPREF1631_00840 [Arcanobacterium sp. S3PF19]|nr:hypothetical protein HMPREF1631_00840 [Arcanobacterium sp. S3PF19]
MNAQIWLWAAGSGRENILPALRHLSALPRIRSACAALRRENDFLFLWKTGKKSNTLGSYL